MNTQRRAQFDFSVEFLNGGALQGQAFRLDIDGDDIDDRQLADYLVRDLRLLMVGRVEISNKTIIVEAHKRDGEAANATDAGGHIDLSHTIEDGMITYKGLPAPLICDHLSRADSRAIYAEGTEFQIGRITMAPTPKSMAHARPSPELPAPRPAMLNSENMAPKIRPMPPYNTADTFATDHTPTFVITMGPPPTVS